MEIFCVIDHYLRKIQTLITVAIKAVLFRNYYLQPFYEQFTGTNNLKEES